MRTIRWAKYVWIAVAAILAACIGWLGYTLATDGTNAFKDYRQETCDGKRPERTIEEAGRKLVIAALNNDTAGVCRTLSAWGGQPNNWVTDDMTAQLKAFFERSGLTAENVTVRVDPEAQMGSNYVYYLSGGTGEPVQMHALARWNAGYVLYLPDSVSTPPVPEDPEASKYGPTSSTEMPDDAAEPSSSSLPASSGITAP